MTFAISDLSDTVLVTATAYLHPGHSFVSEVPTEVTTILGSCVAVCVWDEVAGIGGLTHYLLPHPLGKETARSRFGVSAIADLLDAVVARGARAARLKAKVFGGSAMNATLATRGTDIGAKNVQLALNAMRERSIVVVTSDTGGSAGRKLLFRTHDGSAWIKYLGAR